MLIIVQLLVVIKSIVQTHGTCIRKMWQNYLHASSTAQNVIL